VPNNGLTTNNVACTDILPTVDRCAAIGEAFGATACGQWDSLACPGELFDCGDCPGAQLCVPTDREVGSLCCSPTPDAEICATAGRGTHSIEECGTTRQVQCAAPELPRFLALAVGGWHNCAISALDPRDVYCWGQNGARQAVPDDESTAISRATIAHRFPNAIVELALGEAHSCALDASGEVRCWGNSAQGQLGPGVLPLSSIPGVTAGKIAAGADHTCVIDAGTSEVHCWGDNSIGQIVPTRQPDQVGPTRIVTEQGDPVIATRIWGGPVADFVCAEQMVDRSVVCFGFAIDGVIAETGGSQAPTDLFGTTAIATMGLSESFMSYVRVAEARKLHYRGFDFPENFSAPGDVKQIGASQDFDGRAFACVLDTTLAVYCAGDNRFGQIASTVPAANPNFTDVGLTDIRQIGLGQRHGCAVDNGGAVWCWGGNAEGRLGVGSTDPIIAPPRELAP